MAFFEFDNKKIHYEVHGEGAPIVLLNGIMMSTLSWHMFIPALSANNRLILMDFFDQGQSDKLVGQEYDQTVQIKALKGLLDHLGLAKVSLAGVSYGGNIALNFAAIYPEMVTRLVAFHAAPKTGAWLRDVGKSWIAAASDPHAFYNTSIPVIYSPEFYNNNPEWVAVRQNFLTNQVFTNQDFMQALVRLTVSADNYDITDKLGKIAAKTLVVAAEYDPLTPQSDQKAVQEGINGAELVFLPGCGHASMYEKPTLFASLILGFVNAKFEGL
ncbi:MAG: alpha/beta hydrolase [Clostridiales bacterium]|jgi:pimeloyl-ACP methyl ester carboxylesterase|nr:alpha/beta hydrolase [Clostridiales bacterium]